MFTPRWVALCRRHTDSTGRALPCRKTVFNGSGLSDSECSLRLKRRLVAGFNDVEWGDNKRSFHVSQGGWQLATYRDAVGALGHHCVPAARANWALGPWAFRLPEWVIKADCCRLLGPWAGGRDRTEASQLAKIRADSSLLVLGEFCRLQIVCPSLCLAAKWCVTRSPIESHPMSQNHKTARSSTK